MRRPPIPTPPHKLISLHMRRAWLNKISEAVEKLNQ
jgi:hypothetical protein